MQPFSESVTFPEFTHQFSSQSKTIVPRTEALRPVSQHLSNTPDIKPTDKIAGTVIEDVIQTTYSSMS
jgi:hypothetical protein